tara:strand:+ start:278 stop:709 length:432 start_codon:yes stop_codon:yes gene_type:complete
MAILGVSAIAGKSASPSFDIAFPINAAKGITPLIYSVVTNICGPHPGMNPISTAIMGIYIKFASVIEVRFKPNRLNEYSYIRYATITHTVTNDVSSVDLVNGWSLNELTALIGDTDHMVMENNAPITPKDKIISESGNVICIS